MKSGRAQRDGPKVTDGAQNADLRRRPPIFTEVRPFLDGPIRANGFADSQGQILAVWIFGRETPKSWCEFGRGFLGKSLGRTPRGSCNRTLLRRVLRRFFKGSAS